MNYDKLDKRLAFEQRSASVDALGGQALQWSPLLTCWGSIKQLSGGELQVAQSLHPEVTHEHSIIFNPAITSAHRINFRGRHFEILAAWNVNEDGEETLIRSKEGLTQG